jgi:ABC-type phosphate transport system substrate-binding protein
MRPAPFIVALVGLGLTAVGAGAQDNGSAVESYKVVVNAANPVSALSRKELSRIFLKKVTVWQDATPVALVEQRATSSVRESFTRDVHGRQVASVTTYWQQMIFSGRAVPPPERSSDAEVVAFVSENPAAIGYVKSDVSLPPKVKVVTLAK